MAYMSTLTVATVVRPSQLFMGRQIRTPMPILPKVLNRKWPDLKAVRKHDYKKK